MRGKKIFLRRRGNSTRALDQRNLRNRSPFRSCTNLIRPMHGMRNDRVLRLYVYIYLEKWSSLASFWWTIHHRNTRKRRRSADFTAGYLFFRPECWTLEANQVFITRGEGARYNGRKREGSPSRGKVNWTKLKETKPSFVYPFPHRKIYIYIYTINFTDFSDKFKLTPEKKNKFRKVDAREIYFRVKRFILIYRGLKRNGESRRSDVTFLGRRRRGVVDPTRLVKIRSHVRLNYRIGWKGENKRMSKKGKREADLEEKEGGWRRQILNRCRVQCANVRIYIYIYVWQMKTGTGESRTRWRHRTMTRTLVIIYRI